MTSEDRRVTISRGHIKLDTGSAKLFKSVSYNVHQDLIVVTRDKVELCLRDHITAMEQRHSWHTPPWAGARAGWCGSHFEL
jgi:hypothetical protein